MVGYLAQVAICMRLIVSDMAFVYWARYPTEQRTSPKGTLLISLINVPVTEGQVDYRVLRALRGAPGKALLAARVACESR